MEKELITESNSKMLNIVSVSIEKNGTDTIIMTMEDENHDKVIITIDTIGANGFRIGMASLMDVQPLILPLDKKGDYQCHYERYTLINDEGEILFDKKNGETKPLGKYTEIDDGMILFTKNDKLWASVQLSNYLVCKIEDMEYLTLTFQKKFLDEFFRKKLDKIFPFNRFGKNNKLAYGYFHSSKEG